MQQGWDRLKLRTAAEVLFRVTILQRVWTDTQFLCVQFSMLYACLSTLKVWTLCGRIHCYSCWVNQASEQSLVSFEPCCRVFFSEHSLQENFPLITARSAVEQHLDKDALGIRASNAVQTVEDELEVGAPQQGLGCTITGRLTKFASAVLESSINGMGVCTTETHPQRIEVKDAPEQFQVVVNRIYDLHPTRGKDRQQI